jgi:hypothetical protein
MQRPRTTNAGPVAGILLMFAVLFVVAACGAVGAAVASPSPSEPVPASEAPESEAPESEAPSTPDPSVAPSAPTGSIKLDVADRHVVVVTVVDPEGSLTGASSGRAGDGMSVRWGDVEIVNVDEDSLRVTWVGLPADADVKVQLAADGEGYVLSFTQSAPPAYSDATGFDRVLVLDFASTVKAENVTAVFSAA